MTQTVVILGAGFAGLPLAHKLLKSSSNATRSSSASDTNDARAEAVKIVLVSPNSHFYWNVAAPRGIIPGEIAEDDIFLPIAPTFARYAADEFEFILGAATAVEPERNVVRVRLSAREGTEGGAQDVAVAYDQLVVATGSRLISGLPLKPVGTHETNLAQLRDLQSQIERAASIVIAGGGPTGVEVAGELAAKYGQTKTITLVENSDRVLYDAMPAVRAAAERDLLKLGVKFVYNNRATVASDPLPPPQPGPDDEKKKKKQTEVHLSKGGTILTDLFLPLYGVVVNTSFLPADFLDWEGNLKLQPDMRVLGSSNVWGLGDVGNLEPKQLAVLDAQILHLATALASILTSGGAETETGAYRLGQKQVRFFSMGRRHATGSIGSWKVPGFVVALIKGRKLLVDYAPGYVSGQGMMGTGV